jgi:hypothetical protein
MPQTINSLNLVRMGSIDALRPATYVLARSLAAGVAESITVPTAAPVSGKFVRMTGTAPFYVNFAGTATVPVDTAEADATASVLVMVDRWFFINGLATISVISAAISTVTAEFFTD